MKKLILFAILVGGIILVKRIQHTKKVLTIDKLGENDDDDLAHHMAETGI